MKPGLHRTGWRTVIAPLCAVPGWPFLREDGLSRNAVQRLERALPPKNGMRPVHPGEILREELQTLDLSANALSKALDVPVNRITAILNGQRGVTADTALRLAGYFGTTPQVWLNLQQTYDLRRAEIAVGPRIAECVRPRDAVA